MSEGVDDDRTFEETSRGERLRQRLPYVIGMLGLFAWFALLFFMLRDVF